MGPTTRQVTLPGTAATATRYAILGWSLVAGVIIWFTTFLAMPSAMAGWWGLPSFLLTGTGLAATGAFPWAPGERATGKTA